MRRFWRAETGIFLAAWLGLLISGQTRLFRDPGTFWHTVVGQKILSSGQFPSTDSFSYTFEGEHWIAHQWLGECIMALAHEIDGLDSLLLMTATLLAALYTWIAGRLLREGLHWSLTALLVMLALGASASHFHVRPHLATMVCLGITFAFLCDFEAGRRSMRSMFWLVPVYLLWTNIHGGMLGGLATMALAVGWWSFSWLVGRESPVRGIRQVGWLLLLIVACGLTVLVNPYGLTMPQTWLGIMDSPILPQIIIEHSPLKPTQPDGMLVLLFAAIYLFALAGIRPQWPRATWVLPLVWLFLSWSRVRHAPLFSITALLALAEVLPHTRWAAWLARPGRDLFRIEPDEIEPDAPRWDWRPALLPTCAILLVVAFQLSKVDVPVIGHGWARLDPSYWPVELIDDLRAEADRLPEGTPVFNEYLYGGFLIYHTPKLRVFVDDRCELFGDSWLLDFVRAEDADTGRHIEEWRRRYGGFNLALTQTGSGFDGYFQTSPDWYVVRRTATATLYRRQSPPPYVFGSNACQ